MGTCLFVATGENFQIDAFLKTSPLRPFSVFHKGEIPPKDNPQKEPRPDSGFALLVSDDANQEDLAAQVSAALDFLLQNEMELKRLRTLGAEEMWFDFGLVPGQRLQTSTALPPELILEMGRFGMGLVFSVVQLPRG